MEELKKTQELQPNAFLRPELRKDELTAQVHELQDRVNSMNDSRDFQDVESVCISRLSLVPSKPVVVPSPCGMPSRECCKRPVFDTRDLHGATCEVFENPAASIESGTSSNVVYCMKEILFQDLMAPCFREQGDLSQEVNK